MQALYYNRWWPIAATWSHNENGHKPRILRLVQWFVLYLIVLWMMMEWGWHLSEFHCLTQEQGDEWLDTWVKAVQEANVHSPWQRMNPDSCFINSSCNMWLPSLWHWIYLQIMHFEIPAVPQHRQCPSGCCIKMYNAPAIRPQKLVPQVCFGILRPSTFRHSPSTSRISDRSPIILHLSNNTAFF